MRSGQKNNDTHPGIKPVMTRALATSYDHLVRMDGQALDVISVAHVVSLALLLDVEQHDYSRHEVHYLAGWEKVEVAATVFAPGTNGLMSS